MMPAMPDAGLPPPVDEGNALLAPGPATMATAVNGALGVLTFRTTTATLTIQLPKADLLAWAGLIRELGDSMDTGSALLVASRSNVLLRP
jgi:hypothetical protein